MSAGRERLLAELRPVAFAIAYRMLGSVAEAEDVVQEALLRLNQALERGERIESPRAYLATVTTRLAIDELRSARARREAYVGDWLPEPVVTELAAGPAERVELAESLSVAFLVLLESLTPEERAVLILHDVFDYGYGEVAEIVGKSEDNARQLAVRARRHVEQRPHRFEGSAPRREELGDGGGKVPALARALHGADRVAGTLANWNRQGARAGGSMRRATINGMPGALLLDAEGGLIGAMSLEVAGGEIVAVNSIVNPEKLRHLGRVGDMWGMLRRER